MSWKLAYQQQTTIELTLRTGHLYFVSHISFTIPWTPASKILRNSDWIFRLQYLQVKPFFIKNIQSSIAAAIERSTPSPNPWTLTPVQSYIVAMWIMQTITNLKYKYKYNTLKPNMAIPYLA